MLTEVQFRPQDAEHVISRPVPDAPFLPVRRYEFWGVLLNYPNQPHAVFAFPEDSPHVEWFIRAMETGGFLQLTLGGETEFKPGRPFFIG